MRSSRASILGELYYHVTQSSFGPYVDQVGRYGGAASSGWVFKVNDASPPVGADKVTLKDGDRVLWYYADFGPTGGPPTLSVKASGKGCYNTATRLRRQRQSGDGERPPVACRLEEVGSRHDRDGVLPRQAHRLTRTRDGYRRRSVRTQ